MGINDITDCSSGVLLQCWLNLPRLVPGSMASSIWIDGRPFEMEDRENAQSARMGETEVD